MDQCNRSKYPFAFGCDKEVCCFRLHFAYLFVFIALGLLVIAIIVLLIDVFVGHPRRRKRFHDREKSVGDNQREHNVAESRFPILTKVIDEEEENDKQAGLDSKRKHDLDPPSEKKLGKAGSSRSVQVPKKSEAMPKQSEAMPKKSEAEPKKSEAMPKKSEAEPKKSEAMPLKTMEQPLLMCKRPPPPCKHARKSFKAPNVAAPPILSKKSKGHVHGLKCKHLHHKSPLSKTTTSPKRAQPPPAMKTAISLPSTDPSKSMQPMVTPIKQPKSMPVKQASPISSPVVSSVSQRSQSYVEQPSKGAAVGSSIRSPVGSSRASPVSSVRKDEAGSEGSKSL